MKRFLDRSKKDNNKVTNEMKKSPSPFEAIDELKTPAYFKKLKTKEDYIIQKLKEDIVAGVEAIGDELEELKKIEALQKINLLCDKIHSLVVDHEFSCHFEKVLLEIELIKNSIDSTLIEGGTFRSKKAKGRTRIHYEISYQTLKAIDLCETYKLDLEWIRDFFKPNGDLYDYLQDHYGKDVSVQLPVATNENDNSSWLNKFREGLQRNLFSGDGPVKKVIDESYFQNRNEFYAKIKPQNVILFNDYNDHIDAKIAEFLNS